MPTSTQILATKLYIPPPRAALVVRQRLVNLLNQAPQFKLILICAPAGFGKTTLISGWHQFNPHSALGWLSLDEADNEPVRFLRYLTYALRGFIQEGGATLLAQLEEAQPVEPITILTQLINLLSASKDQQDLFLVLDDYHFIQNRVIDSAISFLLERMPPWLHLVITSRSDPPLPLHRLRARNEILDVRAANLRFTPEETVKFLKQNATLTRALTSENIRQLDRLVEGWAAGLQLALLWLRDRPDPSKALESLSASNRFILDYLAQEVLARQPESLRNFLLATSILSRFNSSLASAVTGVRWGEEDLAQLVRAGLFLNPLDEKGEWFGYHPLFAEFLLHRLKREQPEQVGELHLVASRWFEEHNLGEEAIGHALAARDFHRTADLIEQVAWPMILRAEYRLLDTWFVQIPEEVLYSHPMLSFYFATEQLLKGRLSSYDKLLDVAEADFRTRDAKGNLLELLFLREHLARARNNLVDTLKYAEEARSLLSSGQSNLYRMLVLVGLANIYLNRGEVKNAAPFVEEIASLLPHGGTKLEVSLATFALGDFYLLAGKLELAVQNYRTVIALDPEHPTSSLIARVRLGNIHLEWNEREVARGYLREAEELARREVPFFSPIGYFYYSGLWWPDGDCWPDIDLRKSGPEQMEEYWRKCSLVQIEALRGRIERKERLGELERWCLAQYPRGYPGLKKPLQYQLEPHYLTLARVLIYRGNQAEAVTLLEELKELAGEQGRVHSLIKILILLALAHQSFGSEIKSEIKTARLTLQEALVLAEPGGYLQVFLEEGQILKQLLQELLASLERKTLAPYIYKLLEAFELDAGKETAETTETSQKLEPPRRTPSEGKGNLPELLSERELEVLGLLAEGSSYHQIANRLSITLSTVKKHTTAIYAKLEVANRTQALNRAKELHLL